MPMPADLRAFALAVPKAELHVHIEGTLEPELMFALARRNEIALADRTVDDVRAAYRFTDLQSFLDIYYRACAVLRTEADFYDLGRAYLERAAAQGVRHAEIFFDPQTHTARGVPLRTVMAGLGRARRESSELGLSADLILCVLRHLPEARALETLTEALAFRDEFIGVGLDSSEVGFPPSGFARVFALARAEGLRVVAHAGEEGPPDYIWQALELLEAERIDHGVRCLEDDRLVRHLVANQVPLTVCPFSNVRLRVVDALADHPLPALLDRGLLASVHSDDPAYFGGYVGDNYADSATAMGFDAETVARVARHSFTGSFLDQPARRRHLEEVDAALARLTGPEGASKGSGNASEATGTLRP
ncbi:MAG TPA: adenosine deaminase [Acidimicrobiales bacterium]|nr:adenosine deaminase [Acidimicrobiales bacterium]